VWLPSSETLPNRDPVVLEVEVRDASDELFSVEWLANDAEP
jgi:hypothetical protein